MIWGTAAQAALARVATAAEMVRTLPMKPKNRLLPMFTSRPKPLSHTKGVGNLCTATNYSTETRSVGTPVGRGPGFAIVGTTSGGPSVSSGLDQGGPQRIDAPLGTL